MTIKKGLPKNTRIIMLITKPAFSERSYFRHARPGVCLPDKESAFLLVTIDVGTKYKGVVPAWRMVSVHISRDSSST